MAPAGRSRPSLLGAAPAPEPSRDFQLSILDALNAPEAGTATRAARARRPLLQYALTLAGVGAAVCASALLWAQMQGTSTADTLATTPAPLAEAAAMPAAATSHVTAVAAASPASEAASAAARIEDIGSSVAVTTTASPAASAASAASPFDKLAAVSDAPAAEKAPRTAATKPAPAKRQTTSADKQAAKHPPKAADQPNVKTVGTASRTTGTARANGKAAVQGDADVEIMAALIGHMNETAAAAEGGASTEASIADLVRHCRSLPGAEAQACQKRICQGYWGRADACPARERQTTLRTAG